jgi:hypothetical protein
MIVTFDEERHLYTVDGRPAAAVTKVIGSVIRKPQLEEWIGRLGNQEAGRVRDAASDHGTLVHELVALIADDTPSIPMGDHEAAQHQLDQFREWFDETVEDVDAVELMVAHPKYLYAGRLDFLLRFKGDKVPTIIDIKSGAGVYPETRYQTAAYREALKFTSPGTGPCRRGVLHLPAEGRAKFYEHKRHEADLQGFLSALYLYHDLKRGV